MTIEQSLSGLTYSIFCTLATLLFIGLSIITGTAMVLGFIKSLSMLLKTMKGGMNNLKETAKAFKSTVSDR